MSIRPLSLVLLLVSFLTLFFGTSFAVSVTVTTEPAPGTYYSDTTDINLILNFEGLQTAPITYCFDVNEISYFNETCTDTTSITCNKSNCATKFGFKSDSESGFLIISNHLISPNEREEDEFSYTLTNASTGKPEVSGTKSIPTVINGIPNFSVELFDVNSNTVTDKFPKSSNIQVKLKDISDNSDDFGGTKLICNYSVTGKTKTDTYSGGHTVSEYSFTSFPVSDLGPGSYELVMYCKDNDVVGKFLDDTKKINFKIEDKLPKVDSISLTPATIYPDTKVTCNAVISDEDDPTSLDKNFAWKFKGASTTNVTNQFDCVASKCVSGDTLTCIVTPKNNQTGQSVTKEATVSSYFSTIKISAPSKVQISQEATLNADVTYTGKGTVVYNWTFGDGSSGTGKSVKHTYTSKGSFTVTLTVTDGKNSSAEATTTISVVDADLVISIKSPVTNQEVTKGEILNVKVGLNDNTGTPITDANVTVIIKSGDKNYGGVVVLKPITNTPGLYETNLTVGYLIPTASEVEITAKAKVMFNKKSVPISLTPFDDIKPQFEMETSFDEPKEDEVTVGNTIDKMLVCFTLPANNGFDNALVSNAKMILESSSTLTYDLVEQEGQCYVLFPEYKVSKDDIDAGIKLKFKDAKDIYGNYVKSSFSKTYTVKKGKDVFNAVLLEPNSDKINIGQKVSVKVKISPAEGFALTDIKNITATATYSDKTIKLTSSATEGNSSAEKTFTGEFEQDPSANATVSFKVNVQGEYKGSVVEQEIKKSLTTTNQLNAEIISPAENGSFDEFGKIILAVKYEDGTSYDGNSLSLTINDQNLIFTKNNAGAFETETNQVGFFKSNNFDIKGNDAKGNVLSYSVAIPTMAWVVPILWYYILAGLLIVLIVVFIGFRRTAKTVANISKGRSIEELKDTLAVAKSTVSELGRKYFKQEISEDVFKTQKIPFEKQILMLESQIKILEKQENKLHEDAKDFVENKMPENKKQVLEQKLSQQIDMTTKYKAEIDNLVVRLKPYKNKFTEEMIRTAIKQEKDLPNDVVEKIVKKIYN